MINTGLLNQSSTGGGTLPNGLLKIPASLTTSLQTVSDNTSIASPISLSTTRVGISGRLTFGTTTGTSLLCFPDAGTTAADGIQFGSGTANLYRSSTDTIKSDGTLNASAFTTTTGVFTQNILRVSTGGGLFLGYGGGGGGLKLLPNSGTTVYAEVKATGEFALTPPSLTGSSAISALNITQTLNTTGSPDVINLDVTNTASGASTNLLNLKVGGTSLFKVAKTGGITVAGASVFSGSTTFSSTLEVPGGSNFRIATQPLKTVLVNNTYTNSASASAIMELQSTTQGFLPPKMTNAQRLAIASPATGLIVYCTDATEGLYVYKSTGWAFIV
jgi:hypothetical protein